MNTNPARRKKGIKAGYPAAFVIFLLACVSLQGAVLRNFPVSVTQPNGEKLALFASGDEYYNWLHDKAGYTIIRDQDTGYYVFAKADNGRLISSGVS